VNPALEYPEGAIGVLVEAPYQSFVAAEEVVLGTGAAQLECGLAVVVVVAFGAGDPQSSQVSLSVVSVVSAVDAAAAATTGVA